MSTDERKEKLANLIVKELEKEFENIHLSKNLVNTIKIYKDVDKWVVEIPAVMYDFKTYFSKGVIVPYNGDNSYAELINQTGGFSKQHKNYVEKCINEAVRQWITAENLKAKVRNKN